MNNQRQPSMGADLRLFIAIEFPQEIIDEVARIQRYFKKRKLFEGTYTQQRGMHMTLAFLGEVAPENIEPIRDALRTIMAPAMHASLGSFDFFLSRQEVKVLFLNVRCPELTPLVAQIETVLAPWYKKEMRSFVAHVTIARVKWVPDREKLETVLQEFAIKKIDFTINSFVLKKSELTPDGPVYTDVESYQLQ